MNRWVLTRIALVVFSFLDGVFRGTVLPPEGVPQTSPLENFIFSIAGILLVVGFQRINPLSAKVWRYPRWHINPFLFSEPLQPFHLIGFLLIADGFGTLLHDLFTTRTLMGRNSLHGFAVGSGVLIGIYICTLVFRGKMEART